MSASTDERLGPTTDGRINIKLAHPLPKRDLIRFGLPADEPSKVGDVVSVRPNDAISLINAGMAQVDPEDRLAVTTALRGPEAALDSMPTATSGNDTIDYAELKGAALDKALKDRNLPDEGTADEKRMAVAAYDQRNA